MENNSQIDIEKIYNDIMVIYYITPNNRNDGSTLANYYVILYKGLFFR